jgi:hypothetical protein
MARSNAHWYIEKTDDGRYAAKKGGASRASAIEDTQRAVIERAKEIDPDAAMHIERVRHRKDKWR